MDKISVTTIPYSFYKEEIDGDVLKKSRKDLKNLYSSIPETSGCMENIAKENGCGAKCCEYQNPQVMYVEFLNTWNYVIHNWKKDQVVDIVIKSMRMYLENKPTKGCVFWDSKTKLCTQHQSRPYNCRVYSQTPEEEFKPRYERLKVLYEKNPDAIIMDQCKLTSTIGNKPTVDGLNDIFRELNSIEQDIGIPVSLIHDGDGGSYRTYHDHILLEMGSGPFLGRMNKLRESGTEEEKEAFLKEMKQKFIKL